ncbi:MAG: hypothetical protein ACD_3C00076G0002 [uncultured bacterium (gcode 4)]|uniref:Peptidase M16 C-terminal domain-containing protein n=1 Tax=uncultured bacterium (gcode 4) TaxID=1234023 RepID=K2G244_9BACT|nr:MAG: hypothetical protein ACD_3C00076G0002 [uncultured bacterium (gcode 4)]
MKHSLETRNLSFWAPLTFIDTPDNDLFDFQIFLNSWYQFLPKWKLEVSHILEHCLFEKNKNFASTLEFKYALETLWAGKNWVSTYSLNYYSIQWTRDKSKELIFLLLRLVNEPVLEEEIFLQQKEVVKNEIISARNDFKRELSTMMSALVKEKLISYQERIWEVENISFEDVKSFYDSHYTWMNSKFIIAWDVSGLKDDITFALENYYRNMPKWKYFPLDYDIKKDYAKKSVYLEDSQKSNYEIFLRFIVETEDKELRNKFSFLMNLFMSWLWSRIQYKGRQQWLIYTLRSESWGFKEYLQLGFSEGVSEEKIIPLLKLIIDEIKDVIAWNVEEQELERARWYMQGNYLRNFNSWGKLIEYYTDRLILDEGKLDFYEMLDRIKKFTKEDLMDFWKILDFNNWTFWIIGKNAKEKSQEVTSFLKEYINNN